MNSKRGHQIEAKKNFEAGYRVAERCGDHEGAGRAVLVMIEEMGQRLDGVERKQMSNHLKRLLSLTQQTGLRTRIEKALALIQPCHTHPEVSVGASVDGKNESA